MISIKSVLFTFSDDVFRLFNDKSFGISIFCFMISIKSVLFTFMDDASSAPKLEKFELIDSTVNIEGMPEDVCCI